MGDNLPTIDLGIGRTVHGLSAGVGHTCALLDHYELKCWGQNGSGALGLEHRGPQGDDPGEMVALPVLNLGVGRSAKWVQAAGDYSCALLDNGAIKCWGQNQYGQLGQGDVRNRGDDPGEMGNLLPVIELR
jgi:alpha-tubulin suppressor-like RCC1 family protein